MMASSHNIFFQATIEQSSNKLWANHIIVPTDKAILFKENQYRVVCTINEQHTYQTAILPYSHNVWVIRINKAIMKKLNVDTGSRLEVRIEADRSEFGLEMPEEFAELLSQDEEGKAWFEQLTKGKQRTLIYIISQKKTTEKRIDTGIGILNHLKVNRGKIDYKTLLK